MEVVHHEGVVSEAQHLEQLLKGVTLSRRPRHRSLRQPHHVQQHLFFGLVMPPHGEEELV